MASRAPILTPRVAQDRAETHGPYIGVVDVIDPANTDRTRAHRLINMYPQDPAIGIGVTGRPGFEAIGQSELSVIRRHFQYTKLDGDEITGRIVGGEIQQLEWLLAGTSDTGLFLPNTAGNYASTPDAAPISVTGDIDVRAHVVLPDWDGGPYVLLSKWSSTPGQRSYQLSLLQGQLMFNWSEDGSNVRNVQQQLPVDPQGNADIPANAARWLRVTLDVNDGSGNTLASFYLSETNSNYQLFGTSNPSGTTSIFDGTSELQIGDLSTGVGGKRRVLYQAQVWDGIEGAGGTLEFDADFKQSAGTTSFAEDANAATVTINQSGTPSAAILAPWTTVVSATDLSVAGVTLSSSARPYTVIFADLLVISDGVGKPFTWDGTAGSAGLTLIVNASSAWYGSPTIYYAKLFGIRVDARNVFEWSEENDPFTGYQAGGFNNQWQLGQTDQEPLYAIRGTNPALYYWRAFSTGAIFGAANPDFRSTGVHEAVSPEIGTVSPDALVKAGDSFWLIDSTGFPQRLVIGSETYVGEVSGVPLWKACEEEIRQVASIQLLGLATGAFDNGRTNLVLIGLPTGDFAGSPNGFRIFTFTVRNGEFAGVWQSDSGDINNEFFETLDIVKDNLMRPRLVHCSVRSNDFSTYLHGLADDDVWDDIYRFNGTFIVEPIEHIVEGLPFFFSTHVEQHYTLLDIELDTPTGLTLEASYTTPYGESTPLLQVVPAGRTHVSFGWNGTGRYNMPKIRSFGSGGRLTLKAWTVMGHPVGAVPAAR